MRKCVKIYNLLHVLVMELFYMWLLIIIEVRIMYNTYNSIFHKCKKI